MLLSYISGTIAVLIWALLPVLVKSSFKELPVSYFLLLRFILASGLMGFLFWKLRGEIARVGFKVHALFTLVLGANYWLQSLAIKDLPVSWYIVVFALNPLLALLLVGVKINRDLIISVALGLGGVFCFILTENQILGELSIKSFLYLFGGMLTWVLYTFLAKSHQKKISDSTLTALTQIDSLVAVLLIWLIDGSPWVSLQSITTIAWTSIFLSGVCLPLAYYLYLYSLRRTPVFCQMSQYLELIFGLFFSWLIFNEQFTVYKSLGSGLIVISLYFSTKKSIQTK